MGFAQHQSFYLRDGWLRKGMKEVVQDPYFFLNPEAGEKIGLGKNMVQSLRFWMQATGVAEEKFDEKRKKYMQLTTFGKEVNHFDPYLELNFTVALIHYHLVLREDLATTWYWFFQQYSEKSFRSEQILQDLSSWVNRKYEKSISEKSLKRDVDCILRTYIQDKKVDDPEETIESPLSGLNLLAVDNKSTFYRQSMKWSAIGLPALFYVLLQYGQHTSKNDVSLEELVSESSLWGHIYHLNRSEIIDGLEKIVIDPQYKTSFVRTNELNLVRFPSIEPNDFLKSQYEQAVRIVL